MNRGFTIDWNRNVLMRTQEGQYQSVLSKEGNCGKKSLTRKAKEST